MKLTDIIQCRRTKKTWTATDCRNSVQITRDTKEQAIGVVVGILIDQAYNADPSYFWSPDNTVWVLRYCRGSWGYDMVRSAKDGHTRVSMCVMSVDNYSDALEQMHEHKKQYDADLV